MQVDQTRNKNELVIIALQQRIGEIVAMYEGQVASLRAEVTLLIDSSKKDNKDAEN